MNAYYIQDRLEAQSWARHYQQIAREEKEAELADDMEKGLPQHLFESLCIDHLQRHGASKKAINRTRPVSNYRHHYASLLRGWRSMGSGCR